MSNRMDFANHVARPTPAFFGDGARIASHAIVLTGQRVGDGEAVGSFPADRI